MKTSHIIMKIVAGILVLFFGLVGSQVMAAKKGKCPSGYYIYKASSTTMGCKKTGNKVVEKKWEGPFVHACESWYYPGLEVPSGPRKGEDLCFNESANNRAAIAKDCVIYSKRNTGPPDSKYHYTTKRIHIGRRDTCSKLERQEYTDYKDMILFD